MLQPIHSLSYLCTLCVIYHDITPTNVIPHQLSHSVQACKQQAFASTLRDIKLLYTVQYLQLTMILFLSVSVLKYTMKFPLIFQCEIVLNISYQFSIMNVAIWTHQMFVQGSEIKQHISDCNLPQGFANQHTSESQYWCPMYCKFTLPS